jgi:hypothetical protein
MPTLRNHTHCQVAQKNQRTDQNLSKSMAAQTHGQTVEIKHENTTHGIVHAGFSGIRAFVARKKSRYKLIGFHLVIPHDTIPSTVGGNAKKKT